MSIGIYQILCKANNKIYIGSSINVAVRWTAHIVALRGRRHNNKHLQHAWNRYGEDSFEFSILEEVKRENLLCRENEIIFETRAFDRDIGFNINLTPFSRLGMPHSEATKRKISAANIGRIRNVGSRRTQATRLKMSVAQKGRIVSAKTAAKISATLTGRKPSVETCAKISASNKGRPKPPWFGRKIAEAQAIFSIDQVRRVRLLSASGMSARAIGRQYGTCHTVVKKAVAGLGPFYSSV